MKESLIDTDILSYFLRNDQDVVRKVNEYMLHFPALSLSLITCYEIISGLSFKNAQRQIKDFENLLLDCNVLNISETSIRLSANVSGHLRRKGITIGNSDLLIAGIALEHNLVLVTNNTKHFEHIPNLKIDNWKMS